MTTLPAADPMQLPEIRKILTVNAPITKVWDAVATSEGLAAWFMPNDFEPLLGHAFHLDAGAFGKSPCVVTVLEPPHKVAFRWARDWTLSFTLEAVGAMTRVTLVHAGWDAQKLTEFGQPHPMVRERMAGGWDGLVVKLQQRVEG